MLIAAEKEGIYDGRSHSTHDAVNMHGTISRTYAECCAKIASTANGVLHFHVARRISRIPEGSVRWCPLILSGGAVLARIYLTYTNSTCPMFSVVSLHFLGRADVPRKAVSSETRWYAYPKINFRNG